MAPSPSHASAPARLLRPTLVVGLALLAIPGAGAAKEPLRFTRYGTAEGLSDSTVRDLLQDRRGFIWIATWAGLDRFDGVAFKSYRAHRGETGTLSDNEVWTLFEDRDENLWVGTGSGVDLYDRRVDRFSRIRFDLESGAVLEDVLVYSIVQDRGGALWMGSQSGLLRFDPSTGEARRYRHDPKDASSLSADTVWDILQDRRGALWLGTGAGLDLFDPATGTSTRRALDAAHAPPGQTAVRALAQDPAGALWVGTQGGLDRLDPETGELAHYRHDPGDPNSLASDTIRALLVDRDGALWVGTSGGGLDRYDREADQFVHATHHEGDHSTLSSDNIFSLLEDAGGHLWVGNFAGGLHFLDRHDSGFEHVAVLDGEGPRLGLVLSLLEDPDGTLWVGTLQGLHRVDGLSGRSVLYDHDPQHPHTLSTNTVLSITRDREGVLWVGTLLGGLNRLDEATGRFTTFRHDPRDPTSLSDSSARTLLEDGAGRFWVGTSNGLNRLDRATGEFTRYGRDDPEGPSLAHDWIAVVVEDRDGRLWIGTRGGLSRYDPATDRFVGYPALSGLPVWAIYQDTGRNLWVGTRGGGLLRLDPESGATTSYREADGLSSDLVSAIVEDERGHLWVSTHEGLSDFDPKAGAFVNFGVGIAVQAGPFLRAALRSRSGALLFGGEDGLSRFRPGEITRYPYVPPIVITDLRVFNSPVPIDPDGTLTQQISDASSITLTHDQSVFSFDFAALSYRNPTRNRYAYMLEGFDRDWVESRNRRSATYTNLDPAEYVFRVKGSNDSGVWNEEGASIGVVIKPPFWETAWFRGVALLALGATILGVHLLRTRSIRHRTRLLQLEIDQRVRAEVEREKTMQVMEATNVALEKSNLELAARNAELDRFAYTVSHDLKSPLVTIGGYVGFLMRDAKVGDFERLEQDIQRISTAIERMRVLLTEVLALSRAGRRTNPPRDVDLNQLVREALALVQERLTERGIEVRVAPNLPWVYGDRVRLLEVLQNALDNATKFMGDQPEPRVEVSATSDGNGVVCRIRDNGIGIDPRHHERVFGLFNRLDPEVEGTGIGLAIVRQIIDAHHGRVWVESTGEGGSTLCFALPHKPVRPGGDRAG